MDCSIEVSRLISVAPWFNLYCLLKICVTISWNMFEDVQLNHPVRLINSSGTLLNIVDRSNINDYLHESLERDLSNGVMNINLATP